MGRSVFQAEVGYRNGMDAAWDPWVHGSGAPADPALQATLYSMAATSVLHDAHLAGMFFYAWDNGLFAPSSAAQVALLPARSPTTPAEHGAQQRIVR